MRHFIKLLRLRLLQIEMQGYETASNKAALYRVAPQEARLRAEVAPL